MVLFRVMKDDEKKIMFKTSHLQNDYRSIDLKRQQKLISEVSVYQLNGGPVSISKLKYQDLVSLCMGQTPVIRLQEHKNYYMNFVHAPYRQKTQLSSIIFYNL